MFWFVGRSSTDTASQKSNILKLLFGFEAVLVSDTQNHRAIYYSRFSKFGRVGPERWSAPKLRLQTQIMVNEKYGDALLKCETDLE